MTKLVRLELEEDRHLQFVQERVEQLRLLDDDLTIVCSGGHTLLTNTSFLGLHSAVVREAGQQGATLLVPASREEVGLLYELLVRGEVTSSTRDQLETVTVRIDLSSDRESSGVDEFHHLIERFDVTSDLNRGGRPGRVRQTE